MGWIIMIVIVGGLGFWVGIHALYKGIRSRSWHVTQGQITESRTVEYIDEDGDHMYRPVIVYTYTVDGREYEGDRIKASLAASSSSNPPKRESSRYQVGDAVDVHYNPQNPYDAALEMGISWSRVLFGLAFGAIMIGLAVAAWPQLSTQQESPEPTFPEDAEPLDLLAPIDGETIGFFLVAGIPGFIAIGDALYRGIRSRRWPAARGRITESRVDMLAGAGSLYEPCVTYAYTVEGQEYQGDKIMTSLFPPYANDRRKAQARLSRYPEGAEVAVYYNPAAPAESALETGIMKIQIALGLLLLAVAFFVGYFLI